MIENRSGSPSVATRRIRWGRVVGLSFFPLLFSLPTFAQSRSAASTITFYVTDFGINQWSEKLCLGADLTFAENRVFPEIPPAGQILVPMPSLDRFHSMSDAALISEIETAVMRRVEQAQAVTVKDFEVQLVQNIGRETYISNERQRDVDRFGRLAYRALANVAEQLRGKNYEVNGYAITGSNGVKMLAASIDSWRGFLTGADFFDGRAFMTPMIETIEALGEANVRFFNTKSDWPAPYTPVGFRSVGNFDTVKALKDRFPGISSFLLQRVGEPEGSLGSGHLAGMLDGNSELALWQNMGPGKMRSADPWIVRGRDLRPATLRTGPIGFPSEDAYAPSFERIRTTLDILSQTIDLLESILEEPVLPDPFKNALSFLPAILEDIELSHQAPLHPLASHTFEELGHFGLSTMPDLVDTLQRRGRLAPSFKLPPTLFGLDDFVAGFASQIGRGSMGIDELTDYLDGVSRMTAAVAGAMVGGAAGARIGESGAGLAITIFRGATEDLFRKAVNRPVQQRMLEQWRTLQERRIAEGRPIQKLEEMFESPLLVEAGFDPEMVWRANQTVGWANETQSPSLQDLGGVDITLTPEPRPQQLEGVRLSVLSGRPNGPSLSWSLSSLPKASEVTSSAGSPPPTQTQRGWAVSLAVLQDRLAECNGSFVACPQQLSTLGGLTRLGGYVVDLEGRDVILFGQRAPEAPALKTEDFAVALRNSWYRYATQRSGTTYYTAPGCSIDPDPAVVAELQQTARVILSGGSLNAIERLLESWRTQCSAPQTVRLLGVPPSRFARILVEADYLMKRIVDGSLPSGASGFLGLPDRVKERVLQELETGSAPRVQVSAMNRFEFVPGESVFGVDEGIVQLESCPVRLLTEAHYLSLQGSLVGSGKADPLAEALAEEFSTRYREIAARHPIYRELEDLFRFVAVAQMMREGLGREILSGLLEGPIVTADNVGESRPGVSSVTRLNQSRPTSGGQMVLQMWIPTCGGVRIDIEAGGMKRIVRRLEPLRAVILAARPDRIALNWRF